MYSVTRFGAVTLPIYNLDYTISPLPADMSGILPVGSNVFDGYGSDRSPLKLPAPISYKCVAHESTLAALRLTMDALRALVGRRDWLYRVANDDSTVQLCQARLAGIDIQRSVVHRYHFEMTLQFVQLGGWRGNSHGDWRFDSGEILDDGLTLDSSDFQGTFTTATRSLTLLNNGNLPVDDAILTLTAGSGSITSVQVTAAGIDWSVSLTALEAAAADLMVAGSGLLIDAGAHSVTINGDDAYRNFTLGASHRVRNWLYLEPGSTVLTATVTGTFTGASLSISFRDRWA